MSDIILNAGVGSSPPCIVLDIGTQSIRMGYGGEDLPKSVVPTCLGIPNKDVDVTDSNKFANLVFPLKPWEKRDYIEIIYPFKYNYQQKTIDIMDEYLVKMIQDMSALQKYSNNTSSFLSMHNYSYESMEDRISGHSLVIPIYPIFNANYSNKLAEIAFEKLEVASLFTSRKPVLSCFACGRTSGIVVDIGASVSDVSCVQDGHCIQSSIQEYPVAGDYLDHEIYKKLQNKANILPEFGTVIESAKDAKNPYSISLSNVDESYLNWGIMHIIREIKHSCLFFPNATISNSECQNSNVFVLPDGNTIDITPIRNNIPNLLFKPNNSSQGYPGIVQMIINSIIEISNVKDVSNIISSIVLSGGTTLINGFDSKLHQSIIDQRFLLNNQTLLSPRIVASPRPAERLSSAWIGASILSSLNTFPQFTVSKRDYQEFGSNILNKRCP